MNSLLAHENHEPTIVWSTLGRFIWDSTSSGSSFSPFLISSSLFSLTWKGSFLYLLYNDKVGLSYSVKLRMKKKNSDQLHNARDLTDLYRCSRGSKNPATSNASFELLKMLGRLKISCQQNCFSSMWWQYIVSSHDNKRQKLNFNISWS